MWPFDWFMKDDPTTGRDKGKKGSIHTNAAKNKKSTSWATVAVVVVLIIFLFMAYGKK